jgi:signal transduction histidine kinase
MASEVAQHQVRSSDSRVTESLSLISGTAREFVDSMSDIVWAVNPNRDRLSDLTHRMRRFADDILSARGIGFIFTEPDGEQSRLGAAVRREVFLIFKETVNNIVRHSDCSETTIDFHIDRGWLVLELRDNGRGFDPAHPREGNGLMSMQKRAASLGGTLEVISGTGKGAAVILRAPLNRRT